MRWPQLYCCSMLWDWRASGTIGTLVFGVAVAGCSRDSTAVRVTIPSGATMRTAADSLAHADALEFPRLFSAYAKARSSDRGIKAGTYLIPKNASWNAILASLRGGGAVSAVLIPEGFTVTQIEALIAAKLAVSPDSVAAAVRDTALIRRLDVPTSTLEGYLFPDTYFFPPGTSARSAVTTMVRRFEQQWRDDWRARLDTLALTRHAVVTLASIVEREAKLAGERPVIAAVYLNRLRRGMRLQADPTVQYALPQYQKRLRNKHLRVDSPYNTYLHKGLPPGPIGVPGLASLLAALHPADVPYLYFVAYPDGHHEFRVKLDQHLTAARAARRAWDALKTKQTQPAKAPATKRGG